LISFLSGITYSSGVMSLIITLSKIFNFKTNLNLGFVDSFCSLLSLLVCFLFTLKIKNTSFKKILNIAGIISFLSLILMAIYFNVYTLVFYLLVRYSLIIIVNLITDNIIFNMSNWKDINTEFKAEYYFLREVMLSISRSLGYLLLLIVSFLGGISFINLILIFCALALLFECFLVGKLSTIN